MSEQTTQLDIHALIEARDFVMLKAAVKAMEIHDLTEMIGDLEEDDLAIVFRLLPHDQAAEIFGDLPIERQEYLLEALSSEKVSDILNDMPPDERTELLLHLTQAVTQLPNNFAALRRGHSSPFEERCMRAIDDLVVFGLGDLLYGCYPRPVDGCRNFRIGTRADPLTTESAEVLIFDTQALQRICHRCLPV